MTASRTLSFGLMITAFAWGYCSAGTIDSTSWRWTAWSPHAGIIPYGAENLLLPPKSQSFPTPLPTIPATPRLVAAPISNSILKTEQVSPQPIIPVPASWLAPTGSTPTFRSQAPNVADLRLPPASTASADAFVNLTDGPFASASRLTSGNAMPWYLGATAQKLYGGIATREQQSDFTKDVVSRVQDAFQRSGLDIRITGDPAVASEHSLSVVAGTQSPFDPSAIGMTEVGGDGFTFIDKLGDAMTIDQLKTAVANNAAHELAHALGVEAHDPSGHYLDSGVADWASLTSTGTVFSPEAVRSLALLPKSLASGHSIYDGQQVSAAAHIEVAPVPEPTTFVVWGAGVGLFFYTRRPRTRGQSLAP